MKRTPLTIPAYNDEPTPVDGLKRFELVRAVAEAAATCEPPQVFGVHGDWGLGKTSFLHQLHLYLSGECPQQPDDAVEKAKKRMETHGQYQDLVKVVWFEAWRYQNEEAPVVALLHEIRSQLAWYIKALNTVGKVAHVAIRGALLSLEDLTKKIGFQASKIEKAGEKWEKDNLASALPSNTVREQLEQAIDQLLGNLFDTPPKQAAEEKRRRIVVVIDDLDRCNPEGAYRLLEGLKIYLTLRNCVFVLGMNQEVVEDAIAKQIPVPEGSDKLRAERASAYLEKLCQNVWRLPAVREPGSYLLDLLGYSDQPGEADVRVQWIGRAIREHSHACLPPNPRRLKGLANLLRRFAEFLPRTDGKSDDPKADDRMRIREARYMLIVAYVYQFHSDLYRLWESHKEVHDHLLRWARGFPLELTGAVTEEEKAQEQDLPLFRVIVGLRKPAIIRKNTKVTGPHEYDITTAVPDPADSRVFWAQTLIHEAALEEEKAGEDVKLDPMVYQPYLHGLKVSAGSASP